MGGEEVLGVGGEEGGGDGLTGLGVLAYELELFLEVDLPEED